MKRLSAVLLLVFAVPALAEAPTNTSCAYPEPALAAKAAGTTLVGFKPNADGTFGDVKVRHSSGNADLDAAAVACVSAWRYDPKNDRDIAWISYKGTFINWGVFDGAPEGERIGRPHNCDWAYPKEAASQGLSGTTTLRFVISDEGRVRDAQVVKSSGSSLLDNAALTCVVPWHYLPAVKGNKKVAVPWEVQIPWTPDDALVTVEHAPE